MMPCAFPFLKLKNKSEFRKQKMEEHQMTHKQKKQQERKDTEKEKKGTLFET